MGRKGLITIDILYLVDRLEAAVNKGTAVPFSNKRMIDEDECLDIIDQSALLFPKKSNNPVASPRKKTASSRQAKEEGDRIIQMARDESARMAESSEVAKTAQARARPSWRKPNMDAKAPGRGGRLRQSSLGELQERLDELTARVCDLARDCS